jgi:hypothetical protein
VGGMMRAIYKYPLEITDTQKIDIPNGSVLLDAQFQKINYYNDGYKTRYDLCLWALVDTTQQARKYKILIFGTGNPVQLPRNYRHISTALYCPDIEERNFVWHIFEDLS